MLLDTIIAAGGDASKDAELLALAGNVPAKALIELNGQTFLDRIVSALLQSQRIGRVIVVGLPPEHRPKLGPQVTFLPDAGGILQNGEAGVAYLRATGAVSERILACSCDIPLLTPQIVRDFVDQCLPYDVDLCYSIVSKEVMERAFPGSGRTFVPVAEGRFAGGDISMVKPGALEKSRDKIDTIIGHRKQFWKQVRAIGLDLVFLFLIRRLSIPRIERRVPRVLGITGKAIISPHAELAMDVDKPHHLQVVQAALARQAQGA
jgi:GTP:adenosylcobinamide-phosphate guanylyltransferase